MFGKAKINQADKGLTQKCIRKLNKIAAENKKALDINKKIDKELDALNQKMLKNIEKAQKAFNRNYL